MSQATEFQIISPVDGRVYATERYATASQIEATIQQAESTFRSWRKSQIQERCDLVAALAEALQARKDQLAEAVAWQIGRPLAQADETGRFALVTQKHIEAAIALKEEAYPSEEGIKRFVRREGQGVHFSIAPWNYPLGLLPWLITAPILSGNPVILKHSDQTALVSKILQEAYDSIGGPIGVLQTLSINHAQASEVIGSGRMKGVNFIGSVRGGLEVQRAAAGTLAHTHLELGGKDPAYIRTDANLEDAIPTLVDGSFSNAGQSCCSVERIYVHDGIYNEFVERFVEEAKKWTIGNPITDNPMIGPVVKKSAADFIRRQIEDAVSKGATAFASQEAKQFALNDSCYVAPTVLTNVDGSMSAMREETFGPLACIQRVSSDAEAIKLMNDSEFGLTASVWTRDVETGVALADQLESGTVFVNRCDHADLYLPWGGQKMSGLGRCNGREGLLQLSDTKSFHVRSV